MIRSFRWIAWSALGLLLVFCAAPVKAQLGNSGSIEGVVKDPSGSVIPNAKVEISNPVSGFHRQAITEGDGTFRFTNVPFNPYHLTRRCPQVCKSASKLAPRRQASRWRPRVRT